MDTRLNIGAFSKACGIPAKTLRFYHEKGLLVPESIDADTGYRFYGDRSLDRARVIVALRKLEFPLDDIAAILRENDSDGDILAQLESRKAEISREIARQRDMMGIIDSIVASEREARRFSAASPFEVEEQEVAPLLVAGIRMRGRYQDCGPAFGKLGRSLRRLIAGKPMCLYYDGEYKEDDADFEPCFPIHAAPKSGDLAVHELAGGRCLSLRHAGPYEELGRSYAKVLAVAAAKGHDLQLPSREIFLKGPGMIFKGNPRNYLTEIQIFFA